MGEDHAAGTATRAGVGRPRGRGRLILSVSDGLDAKSVYTFYRKCHSATYVGMIMLLVEMFSLES